MIFSRISGGVPGGAACPDRDAFAAAVATRLGYDPFAAGDEGEGERKALVVRFRREQKAIAVLLERK